MTGRALPLRGRRATAARAGTDTARSVRKQGPLAGRAVKLIIFYLLLTVMALVFLVPYILTVFAAFKPIGQIFSEPAWIPPKSLYVSNFQHDFVSADFLRYLGNTALVTCVLTAGQVFFSMLGAYAFARLNFPGRDKIFWLYLLTLMVPNAVTIIPLYAMMRMAHLLNTYWAIFLPYVFGAPYTIFLMRQFFRNIPQEVIDAARVDGCSEWRILARIIVPLSKPVIVTATLIAFVFGWNNFLWPLIVTNSQSHYMLTIGLANFTSNMNSQWNYSLAASVITLFPLAVIFAVFQRHIIRSISITQIR
jgi:multiple sugar transport system permease protein